MQKYYYLRHWVGFSQPQKHPDGILKKRFMSSSLSKIIAVLAPGKAFYMPKHGILNSKWLPPLKAGLITHQLLIPLAYFCIPCLWLGNWASKAPTKLNLPSQPSHFSVLKFNCEMWWHTYMFFFCDCHAQVCFKVNASVFSKTKGIEIIPKSHSSNKKYNCSWHHNFFSVGTCPVTFLVPTFIDSLASFRKLSSEGLSNS